MKPEQSVSMPLNITNFTVLLFYVMFTYRYRFTCFIEDSKTCQCQPYGQIWANLLPILISCEFEFHGNISEQRKIVFSFYL